MDKLSHKRGVGNAERLRQYELHHPNKQSRPQSCSRKATPSPPVKIVDTDIDSPEIIKEAEPEQPTRKMGKNDLGQLIGRIVEDTLGDGNCFLHSYIRGVKQRNKKLKWMHGEGFAGCSGLHDETLRQHLRTQVSEKLQTCNFCKKLPECAANEEAERIKKVCSNLLHLQLCIDESSFTYTLSRMQNGSMRLPLEHWQLLQRLTL